MQQGKQVWRGRGLCSLDIKKKRKKKKSSYKITPFLSLCISISDPQFSHHSCICVLFLSMKTILTSIIQPCHSIAAGSPGRHPVGPGKCCSGPNFIIWGTVICLHSHVSDDDRVCLVPNHMKFGLEAARNSN